MWVKKNGVVVSGGGGGTPTPVVNKWENKIANFLGDSITAGTGTTKTYHQYLKENLSFLVCNNYGISGSTIADGSTPMYSRASTMDTSADLVCVFGGTNDFFSNREIGSLYTVDASGNRSENVSTATFYGALHTLCKNLISTYSGKQIMLLTPLHRASFSGQYTDLQRNSKGYYLEDYVDAILKIGKWYSIPVCNLYESSGLQPQEPNNRSLYFSSTDGLHPNTTGHSVLANKIQGFLNVVAL